MASPPHARNWSIGCLAARRQEDGEFESFGEPVAPSSLYLQQLRDRLGEGAVANIGYGRMAATGGHDASGTVGDETFRDGRRLPVG